MHVYETPDFLLSFCLLIRLLAKLEESRRWEEKRYISLAPQTMKRRASPPFNGIAEVGKFQTYFSQYRDPELR